MILWRRGQKGRRGHSKWPVTELGIRLSGCAELKICSLPTLFPGQGWLVPQEMPAGAATWEETMSGEKGGDNGQPVISNTAGDKNWGLATGSKKLTNKQTNKNLIK